MDHMCLGGRREGGRREQEEGAGLEGEREGVGVGVKREAEEAGVKVEDGEGEVRVGPVDKVEGEGGGGIWWKRGRG